MQKPTREKRQFLKFGSYTPSDPTDYKVKSALENKTNLMSEVKQIPTTTITEGNF